MVRETEEPRELTAIEKLRDLLRAEHYENSAKALDAIILRNQKGESK